jgi:hypothetical protein
MPAIKYRVPYEFTVNAVDLGRGKRTTNIYYLRTAFATGTFAYADSLPGSDTATLMTSVGGSYVLNILPVLNANYKLTSFVLRSILGKQYRTPFFPIAALVPGAPISISTMFPHNFVTGMYVYVRGVSGTVLANGVRQITVTSTTSFTLNGSNDAVAWGGDGEVQLASGPYQFSYGDTLITPQSSAGGVTGDAYALFATGSVRRLNVGVGKNFRSRISVSPFSESDIKDGAFTSARQSAINAAWAAWNVGYSNGGTDPIAGLSYHVAVSKKIAQTLPLIFPSDQPWTAGGVTFSLQPNTGSLVRRKPKLTAPIV